MSSVSDINADFTSEEWTVYFLKIKKTPQLTRRFLIVKSTYLMPGHLSEQHQTIQNR